MAFGTRIDDNFGTWEIDPGDDPEEMEKFYDHVQNISVEKECRGCLEIVRIMPQYGYCNSCATQRERGWDF